MTDPLLDAAAEFLDLLTQDPEPDEVCVALTDNHSMPAGVVGASIVVTGPPRRELARHGAFPATTGRDEQLDRNVERCLREGRILLIDPTGRHVPAARPVVAYVPIRAVGRSAGVLVLAFAENEPWSIAEYRAAEGFADSLGLWLGTLASAAPMPAPTLTTRQRRVLQLLADTRTTAEIAHALGVSRTTTKTDVRAILSAFGVADRTAAVRIAAVRGLIVEPRP